MLTLHISNYAEKQPCIRTHLNREPRRWKQALSTKPKVHMFDHAIRRASLDRYNPLHHWCFADEDFIGAMCKISQKINGKHRERRTIERFALLLYMGVQAS